MKKTTTTTIIEEMCPGNETVVSVENEGMITNVEEECVNNVDEQEMATSNICNNQTFIHRISLIEATKDINSLWKIVWPVMTTTLLLHSKSLVSVLFLGHLGDTQLAGGALALSFANITGFSVIKGLSMGMEPICSQAYGARKFAVISQTFQKTVCLLILTAIAIAALWLNMEPILVLLRQDQDIIEVAKIYLRFSIPELIAQVHLHPLRSFLRTQGITTPVTIFTLVFILLHIPINFLLVMYFDLGVEGVALALACNTFGLNISMILYLNFSKVVMVKPWHELTILSPFKGWSTLLSLALPSVLSVCLEWWWYEIMLFFCGILENPKASVAAMGILIQTTGLLYVFPHALSSGLSTRVGHELGADNPQRAQRIAIIGMVSAIGMGITAFLLTISVHSIWGRMYTSEPDILKLVSVALPILGFCEIGNCPQTAACGVLTGSARPKAGAKINFVAFYLVGLPVALGMAFGLNVGFIGLWFGLAAAQVALLVLMVCTLMNTDWKHQAKRSEELTRGGEDDVDPVNDLETALLA